MANSDWITLFPDAELSHLTAPRSDHVPVMLTTGGVEGGSMVRGSNMRRCGICIRILIHNDLEIIWRQSTFEGP